MFELEKLLSASLQRLDFLKIHLNSRKIYARKSYLKAFNAGEEWPNPQEFKDYKIHNKLQSATRDWGQRLQSMIAPKEEKKGDKKEKKEGSGEEKAEEAPAHH
jgi:hypothetical protein